MRSSDNNTLTWTRWNGFDNFLELASRTYPEIAWEYTAYAGANRTGYSWAQMRAGDIPDIFISSQIIDEDLAKERLVDLADYDFIDGLSTALLDQAAIDGGIYALPVNNVMYGIYYNKTLMEEHNWALPADFAELEALCGQIKEAGLEAGYIGMQLTGVPFAAVFNLAKTGWYSTLDGVNWERSFLAGNAAAAGSWEGTMDYVQKYIDIGMFNADPEDHSDGNALKNFVGTRQAVFCTSMQALGSTQLENGDEIGIMPFISEDGGKNLYMYSPSCYIGISRALTEPGNEEKLEYAVMTMTGAQAKELAGTGFAGLEDGEAYPYVLVTRGGIELEDGETYRVAFTAAGYTEEVDEAYNVQAEEGTLSAFVRAWLEDQRTVPPDGNPWE